MTVMTDILKVFEYNQHFVAMMNIINMARLNPPESGHKHHIIPKCWFRKNNLTIDNSDDNLVLLTKEQHMKVHKLAAMCIIGSYMRSAMGLAAHMLDGSFRGMHHYEEIRRKISESMQGRVPWNKGKHNIYSDETRKKMSEAKKDKKLSEETRRKMSDSHKGKVMSDETRRNMSEAKKGRTFSEEHRRKLSEAKKGKVPWDKGIHQKEIKQRGEY